MSSILEPTLGPALQYGQAKGARRALDKVAVLGSTRVKLFLLIALALTPLIGFRAYDLASMREQSIENAKRQALELARDGAERQGSLVAQASAMLDVAVEVPALREGDRAGCTAFLTGVKQRSSWAGGFGLIGLNGHPVCSNDTRFRDVDLSDRDYFKEALRTDRVYVSNLLIARTTGRPNVVLARAVRDAKGQATGVLIATIDLAWLEKLVSQVEASEAGLTLLLDRTGNVLARSPHDPRLIGRNLSHIPAIAEALNRTEAVSEGVGVDGVRRLGAVTTIPISGEKLIVAFDKSVVVAQANAKVMQNVVRFGILVLGAALLAWLGGELLFLRWVRRLAAAADKLGRGEFAVDARMPAIGGELAAVDRALQTASRNLGQRDEALRLAEADAREANRRLIMAEQIAQIGHWRAHGREAERGWMGDRRLRGDVGQSVVSDPVPEQGQALPCPVLGPLRRDPQPACCPELLRAALTYVMQPELALTITSRAHAPAGSRTVEARQGHGCRFRAAGGPR